MAIYDLNNNPQPKIGKRDYWRNFERLEDSILHLLFLSKIIYHLDDEILNSSTLGSSIIADLEGKFPKIFEENKDLDLGSLFGMTLWNILVLSKDEWYFKEKSKDEPIPFGKIYWRKRQEL